MDVTDSRRPNSNQAQNSVKAKPPQVCAEEYCLLNTAIVVLSFT
jgi:hypothetical protein